jgi:hypothetical protein
MSVECHVEQMKYRWQSELFPQMAASAANRSDAAIG